MIRSVCQFVLLALGVHLLFSAPGNLFAQNVTPVKPNRIRISDSSPLNRLKSRPGSVSPASFLRTNQETKSASSSKTGNEIPSILSGKKSVQKVKRLGQQSKSSEIDPLNIPSSPIQRKRSASVPTQSTFQPSTSGFAPPKSTQFGSAQPIQKSAPRPIAKPSSQSPSELPVVGSSKTWKPKQEWKPTKPASSAPALQAPTSSAKPASRVNPTPTQNSTSNLRNSNPPSVQPRVQYQSSTSNQSGRLQSGTTKSGTGYPGYPPRVADRSPRIEPGMRLPINRNSIRDSSSQPQSFSAQQSNPQLQLISSGPKSITVNKAGDFVVKIVNTGRIDATDVVVGIEIPKWVEIVGKPQSTGGEASVKDLGEGKAILWELSYLPTSRDAMISLKLEPKENRAFNLKTEWSTAPVSNESQVMVTQAKLATRINGPTEVKYGEKAIYTITIENTGNGDADKVEVALSQSLGGDSASVGVIQAGESKQFEVELTAGEAGALKLEAAVSGDAGVRSAIAKEIVVRRAKLVVKAAGPKFKYAGSALTYNITVENQGDASARNINAAALLPLNAEYISGLNQVTENEGRKIGWKISEIPAGAKRNFIVTCLINRAGDARMEIGVRSEDGLTSGGIVNTKVEALADLKLEVVDPRGPQAVGRQVTYELHITNRGTKAARNVQISGEFSDFIDPVTGAGAKSSIQKGGVIVFAPIPEIKVGESAVVKIIAKASQPGTHTFRAIVECKDQDIRKVSEGTTKFFGDGVLSEASTSPKQIEPEVSQQPASELPPVSPNANSLQPGN